MLFRSKEFACNAGDLGLIPGLRRSPGAGHGNPFQYSYLENPHGQRSLGSYSSWGHKKSDMTEQLSTAQINQPSTLMKLLMEYSSCLTAGWTTKPQSSRQYGTGTKTEHRPMEQNRKPRDKSTHLTTYLQQRRQEYTMEKRQSL